MPFAVILGTAVPAAAQTLDTTPTSLVDVNSGLCVAVAGASTTAGAAIVQASCNGSTATLWTFQAAGSNYRLVSQGSGMCLDVPGSSKTAGTALVQLPCATSPANNEMWQVSKSGNAFQVASVASGMCINTQSASKAASAPMIQWPCQTPVGTTATNDQFIITNALLASPATELVSVGTGLCVSVPAASTASGTALVEWPCGGQASGSWTLVPAPGVAGAYRLAVKSSGMCLNVPGNSKASGTQLIQWPCQTSSAALNDVWYVKPFDQGYHVVSASSGQCVNVSGDAATAGTAIVQWPCQLAGQLNDQFTVNIPSNQVETLPSTWSSVIPLAVTPVAAANLPNGKLMMWASNQLFSFQGDVSNALTQTQTGIFDPSTNASSVVVETAAGSDMFCPGTTVLADGRLLVNGGDSSPKTSIYDWRTNAWTADATMNVARGYEANTLLSNGSAMTFGGSWSGGQGNKTAEVWTAGSGWRLLSGVPATNVIGPDPQGVYRGDNHLWLFAQSNGSVFHAGPSAQMNWITTSGAGTIASAGNRADDTYSINGIAVMYAPGKILKAGGAASYQQNGSTTTYANTRSYLIDITGGVGATPTVTKLSPMNYGRSFANGVVLPDGSVVVVGGQTIPQPFTDTAAILTPEIWNPSTQQFNLLAPMQVPRTYHSTALLLPDARVFVGGGGLCGNGCPQNHSDAEILTPPYLLNIDGTAAARPVITSAPQSATRGATIAVTTDRIVASFSLMRLSATTHTVNNDQRRIPLQASAVSGTTYTLPVPADPGVVLPGYYMLFALDPKGVPSVAATLQIP
ncbi:MAG TPA: RICIN domain-containing protein [Burkholderiaceae bacterium]|nr:RICIN domain-containing protein [Burkholderiaceae bacterium]